jgi:general secretion pathway protein E/type IV pilus assembly protein PilB
MTGNIIGVMGQRLIRKLCAHCKTPRSAEAIEKQLLNVDADDELIIHEAAGCSHCDGTGYRGRIAVIEVLRMDDELDELIARKATLGEIKKYTRSTGYRNLADDATARVLEGLTSLEEISRVIDLTDRL